MTAEAPRPPSCCIGSSTSVSPFHSLKISLLFLCLLSSPAAHALPQGTNPSPGTGTGSDDENNNGDSDSSLSRDGMLNLYFLFIAIAVILLVIALLLLHRRKKRRKAMMRNYGQSALAQDINAQNNNNSRWLNAPGRWMMGGGAGASGTPRAPEEGLNERGEAPPPYNQPPGGPPQPAYAPGPNYVAAVPVVAMPVPPPPAWQSDAGLTIPMRTLSRDTQGNKPPDYQEALAGPGVEGGPPLPPQTMADNSVSANSSTGNLIRPGGPNHGETQR